LGAVVAAASTLQAISDVPTFIDEQTLRLLDALQPVIAVVPPPVYFAVLLGIINSCVFYIVFGRGFKLFVPYVVLGSAAAVLGITVGKQLPETGPLMGDASIVAACISTWTILFIARSMHL
jgi:hypothetical protein